QTFELVGRDSNGTPVVKYGFTLKQWFVNRGNYYTNSYSPALSWCNSIGYRVPRVRDLTNASCSGSNSGTKCQGSVGAAPSSPNNYFQRHIGSGFFTEWGYMEDYSGVGFKRAFYWTRDSVGSNQFNVSSNDGFVEWSINIANYYGLCAYP
ncbi:hypothetical protein J3U16_11965, partial [Gilliamella sp. B3023]